MNKKDFDRLLARRRKNFDVKFEIDEYSFIGKIVMLVTHNGHQWSGQYYTKEELAKLRDEIDNYLKR